MDCRYWYQAAYPTGNPLVDPLGPASGSDRVVRGGGWYHVESFFISASAAAVTKSRRRTTLASVLVSRKASSLSRAGLSPLFKYLSNPFAMGPG